MVQDAESLGAYLKHMREEKKISIEDVSAALNTKKDTIDAIESDTILSLMPPAYARGFIRNYSELLELDRHSIIERFDLTYRKDTPRIYVKDVGPLIPAERRQRHNKGVFAFVLLILLIIAIFAVIVYSSDWLIRMSKNKEKTTPVNEVKTTEEKTQPKEKSILPKDQPGAGEIVVPEPVFIFSVELSFSKNTKMKANLDGTDIYGTGKVFGTDATEKLKAEKSLVIEIEESANVSILLNGSKLTGLPARGKVKLTFDEQNKDKPKIEALPVESPQ